MGYMQPGTEGIVGEQRHQVAAPVEDDGKIRGLGDLVHTVLKAVGIDKAVKKATKGKDCGCAARRRALNAAVPFGKGLS